jgi:hypothetical protein
MAGVNTMSNSDVFIDVPPPLYKYEGTDFVHDDNKKILAELERQQQVVLPKTKFQKLSARLRTVSRLLKQDHADQRLAEYEMLIQEYNSNRLQVDRLHEEHEETDQDELKARIFSEARKIATDLRLQSDRLKQLKADLTPIRDLVRERHQLRSKLTAHKTAVMEMRKENELQRQMAREAEIIGQTLTMALSRMGFSYTETVGNKKRVHRVTFDHVVTTPDQHQFKIAATRRGLAGGTYDLLPNGVKITDILTKEHMQELSNAVERPVWSPHVDEDINNTNGAWIVVERLGLFEGIPKKVTYRQIMARYATADHDRIPLPAGLRRGRRINWTYLDSHSSTHIMFTGITGSGKTNTVQACLSAIVEKQSPASVRVVLVDLKNQGDFNELATAPHLIPLDDETPIVTEIPDVVTILERIRSEMHWRQKHIGAIAKNIVMFNKRVQPQDRLPRIVVLFDEFANTRRGRFSDEAAIIDDVCTEITQLGRAAGIHLWIGIQQPRASNMPQSLRDNFTTMFVGHQMSIGAGQSVTGNRASLKLADLPGRMLAIAGIRHYEVQMPLIYEDDIDRAVSIARQAHGSTPLYELHYSDDPTDRPPTDREIILETSFAAFDQCLKYRPMWEYLKPRYSISQVKDIVAQIVSEEIVTWNGRTYEPKKQRGNFYRLMDIEPDTEQESDTEDPHILDPVT